MLDSDVSIIRRAQDRSAKTPATCSVLASCTLRRSSADLADLRHSLSREPQKMMIKFKKLIDTTTSCNSFLVFCHETSHTPSVLPNLTYLEKRSPSFEFEPEHRNRCNAFALIMQLVHLIQLRNGNRMKPPDRDCCAWRLQKAFGDMLSVY